jgi:hypothetical protein
MQRRSPDIFAFGNYHRLQEMPIQLDAERLPYNLRARRCS